jgi:hypothetical protein
MSLSCKIFGHKWNGCKCLKCREIRDEQHDWIDFKCSRCNKEQYYWNTTSVERCTDQKILAYIVKNNRDFKLRRTAIRNLNDQETLTFAARNDTDERVRMWAAERIIDENTARVILCSELQKRIEQLKNQQAISKKHDDSFFSGVGSLINDINKIEQKHEGVLYDIINNDFPDEWYNLEQSYFYNDGSGIMYTDVVNIRTIAQEKLSSLQGK